jgi:hypothetical protein
VSDYYFCLDHHAVEEKGQCRADNRLGPYPTREAAQHALEKVAERNEEADSYDEEWGED